jgi:hypothetical protein
MKFSYTLNWSSQMAEHPGYPDTSDRSTDGRGLEAPPPVPRWVWVSAVVVGVLVVLGVVVMLVSGVQHGPGQHTSSSPMPMSGIESIGVPGPTLLAAACR